MTSAPDWLHELPSDVWRWWQTIEIPDHPGRLRLCAAGDRLVPSADCGLGWTALGLKLATMLNLFEFAPAGLKDAMIERIHSFQTAKGPMRGYFEDRGHLRLVDRRGWLKRIPNIDVRRAETRQAITALAFHNSPPKIPLNFLPRDPNALAEAVRSLPWDSNPWHSGSQLSQMVVFLRVNGRHSGNSAELSLLTSVFSVLDEVFQSRDGSWYRGNPSLSQRINAAMKVYSGYEFLHRPVPAPEKLIDLCLSEGPDSGACNHVDLIYGLWAPPNGATIVRTKSSALP